VDYIEQNDKIKVIIIKKKRSRHFQESGKVAYLKSSNYEQSIDIMDPHLLCDLIQMFSWKSPDT